MLANYDPYWKTVWKQFRKHRLGVASLGVILFFCLVGIYAPFLASSKPLIVNYDGEWYFPLFRYLFYIGFFTKRLDIFFNLLIFTMPLAVLALFLLRRHRYLLLWALSTLGVVQMVLFVYFAFGVAKDPAVSSTLNKEKEAALKSNLSPSWDFDLKYMTNYAKLNLLLRVQQRQEQQQRLQTYAAKYLENEKKQMPTLWQLDFNNEASRLNQAKKTVEELEARGEQNSKAYNDAKANMDYIIERRKWIDSQLPLLRYEVRPLLSAFHWEDDASGSQSLNRYLTLWDLTRVNRKNFIAALIFGVRISLVVGILAVSIALIIALPIGSFAGFYGGKFDIIVSRLLEIWESMPTFFMLLMVVAIMQSKSIFLVIIVIGVFGWTTFSRFIRGEFFKQRNLPYVEACRAMGYHDSRIMFSHILPNAIPPILTLLPFSIMSAITSEAGLSFLGLGEEGSCSWGVLMDEGRTAFPAESYLLWPPAILLTMLLIAIALVGDSLRDALDPKLHR